MHDCWFVAGPHTRCLVCGKATSSDAELYCSHLCCMEDGDKARIDPVVRDQSSESVNTTKKSHLLHEPPISLSSLFNDTHSPPRNLDTAAGMQQLKSNRSVQHNIGPLFPSTNTCATVLDHFGFMSHMRGQSMNTTKPDTTTASLYAAFSFSNRKKRGSVTVF
ncbi:hypothetical protein BJ741DRAFT_591398 [Chytriomyces cf. hyalinus JEL632]|nr:hypothetical protein BJ741DRAFT_591398 [Chytriomyces cf. hyalinus JEL632]